MFSFLHDKKVHKKWNGKWIGWSMSSENATNPSAGRELAGQLIKIIKLNSNMPMMISTKKEVIGVDARGRSRMFGIGISISFPDLPEFDQIMRDSFDSAAYKVRGYGSLSSSAFDFTNFLEAKDWCKKKSKISRCNFKKSLSFK